MALLADGGFSFTEDESEAEAAVVNSCCFIGDAKEESINTIIELGGLKAGGRLKALIVTGCLAQRYAKEIRRDLPEVDAIVGTTAFPQIVSVIRSALKGEKPEAVGSIDETAYVSGKRILTTGGHYAYLKIAEGCSKNCTYCVIPKVRGHYRSIPEEQLLQDAELLAKQGVKELILVAQETTVYGTDLYGKKALPELLRKLCAIEGLSWIRLLYCYPEEIDDELVEVLASEPKLCHYLDLPIQHCSDRILRLMARKATKDGLVDIIQKLRAKIPDITLRTTLISGFPGETEEEHRELLDFVQEMQFDRLGDFVYSREEETGAAKLPGQIKAAEKRRRRDEIMALQQTVAFENAKAQIGRELQVLVEGRIPEEHVYVGRTYRDAPEIDGLIFFPEEREKEPSGGYLTGDLVTVRVTDSHEYDLLGEILG